MKSLENTMDFPLFQETNYVMVINHFTQTDRPQRNGDAV